MTNYLHFYVSDGAGGLTRITVNLDGPHLPPEEVHLIALSMLAAAPLVHTKHLDMKDIYRAALNLYAANGLPPKAAANGISRVMVRLLHGGLKHLAYVGRDAGPELHEAIARFREVVDTWALSAEFLQPAPAHSTPEEEN